MKDKRTVLYRTVRMSRLVKNFTALLAGCAALVVAVTAVVGHLSAAAEEKQKAGSVELPIIMYHGILRDSKRQGKFVISPSEFEADLKYLTEHGYHTIVMQDLIDYVQNGTPLPEKPVMLTFDDGYFNNYVYAYPLLQQYQCKMVLSPIGRYADEYSESGEENANYSNATWARLKEMADSGLVEIQNHTYNLHSNKGKREGASRRRGESVDAYQAMLREDVGKMQELIRQNVGYTPTTFTYPFGAVSKEALPVLKEMGFQATLICSSRINHITRDPDCLYGLGRFVRPSGVSSEQYFTKTVPLPE